MVGFVLALLRFVSVLLCLFRMSNYVNYISYNIVLCNFSGFIIETISPTLLECRQLDANAAQQSSEQSFVLRLV